jgi:hypothetical protein
MRSSSPTSKNKGLGKILSSCITDIYIYIYISVMHELYIYILNQIPILIKKIKKNSKDIETVRTVLQDKRHGRQLGKENLLSVSRNKTLANVSENQPR